MPARAQDRYSTELTATKLPDGRTVFKTARPRIVSTNIDDVVISTGERDRADIMASNVYSSAMDWWRIAAANARVDGSLYFTPGQNVIIPRKR